MSKDHGPNTEELKISETVEGLENRLAEVDWAYNGLGAFGALQILEYLASGGKSSYPHLRRWIAGKALVSSLLYAE